MKKVLVFGTFDLLHEGHASFLRQASSMGDRLIASVARDAFVRRWKGKAPLNPEGVRLRRLLDSGLVDRAFLSDRKPSTYEIINRIRPELICLGYDQDELKEDLKAWMEKQGMEIPVYRMKYHLPDKTTP
jgi:FAD synthetase